MRQFYICWKEGCEEELFCFLQRECGMILLPMLKTKVPKDGSSENSHILFVRESDRKHFHYKRFRDESGVIGKQVYPFDRKKNMLPHIEYAREVSDGKEIARVYLPTISDKSMFGEMKEIFDSIKMWVEDNCKEKEKDGVWIYTI